MSVTILNSSSDDLSFMDDKVNCEICGKPCHWIDICDECDSCDDCCDCGDLVFSDGENEEDEDEEDEERQDIIEAKAAREETSEDS